MTARAPSEHWGDFISRARTAAQEAINELGAGPPTTTLGPKPLKARRGTSNGNSSGSAEDRRRRKLWLLDTYAADVFLVHDEFSNPREVPVSALDVYGDDAIRCCRCFRCGKLVTFETMTVDRIIPGARGGTYRRENIRPCCGDCNSKTGGATRRKSKHRCPDCRREDPDNARRPRPLVSWSGVAKCASHIRNPYRGR